MRFRVLLNQPQQPCGLLNVHNPGHDLRNRDTLLAEVVLELGREMT